MRMLAVIASMLLVQAPAAPLQQQQTVTKAAIEGVVLRAGTGEPLSRAQVMLTRAALRAGETEVPPELARLQVSGAAAIPPSTTDRNGRFLFKDLEPGAYRITVVRNGYARQEYGQRVFGGRGTIVNVAPGQTLKDVAVYMTPAGNVSGTVRDSFGEPVAGLQVQLLRPAYNVMGRISFQQAGAGRTNDRGEYRVYWVTPGRYYVSVAARALDLLELAANSNEYLDREVPTTYYPGVIDVSRAAVIEVAAGAELNGVDITLAEQQLFRIRGRLMDAATGQFPRSATVSLVPRGLASPIAPSYAAGRTAYNSATGTFELRDVAPGAYWVRATAVANTATAVVSQAGVGRSVNDVLMEALASTHSTQVAVDLTGSDIEGLVLTLNAAVSIPGRLSVDGASLPSVPNYERLRVTLRPATQGGITNPTRNQPLPPEGTFILENVVPGDYYVAVAPLPPDFYIKEARLGQTDVLSQPLSITGPVTETLSVVLSPRAGHVSGVVRDDRLQPAPGIQVVLVPDTHRGRPDLYKTTSTDQTGSFSLRDIPPGDYKVFAWEAIESFAYFDPDLIRRFESKGKAIHISESSRQSVEVEVIPAGQ